MAFPGFDSQALTWLKCTPHQILGFALSFLPHRW